ncbi:MAG: tetratricopeptide repeat protein, partial [Sphingomonadales bacterium]
RQSRQASKNNLHCIVITPLILITMKTILVFVFSTLCLFQAGAQGGGFAPTNLGGPAMKYQGLRDTDLVPDAALREKGLKEWRLKRDTTLAAAKKLLEERNYTAVNQLLFPYDYLEPEDALFYEYLGKSYFYAGLHQPALDCFIISNEQKKQPDLLFLIGQCHEKMGNEKEAMNCYTTGAKEGNTACKAKLGE